MVIYFRAMFSNNNYNNYTYSTDETTEDDQLLQDLMLDPIFQEDTEIALTKFLTNFSLNENFSAFVEQLNVQEKKVLQNLNIKN